MKVFISSIVIVFLIVSGYFLFHRATAPKTAPAPAVGKTSFSVLIAVPLPGSLLTATQSVVAIATTNSTLKDIVLQIDGITVATCTTSPCSYDWDTTKSANGRHTILATASDETLAVIKTEPLFVTVSNQPVTQNATPKNTPAKSETRATPVVTHPIVSKPTPTPVPIVQVKKAGTPDPLPTITQSPLVNDSSSTEMLSWKTNVPTTSHVQYGTTSSTTSTYPMTTPEETVLSTDHTVKLTQLVAGKTYYYQIVASDASGHVVTSAEKSFTIPVMTIMAITASDLFATTATIKWTTNFKTEGQVIWGPTSSSVGQYSYSTVQSSDFTTAHTATVTQASAGTTYFYRVISIDSAGNKVTSPESTFTTSKITIGSTHYSVQGETIEWQTTTAVKSELKYGTQSLTTNAYPFNVTDGNLVISHSTLLPGISSNTTYYYRITTTDASGVKVTSPEYSFNS